ncbi:MAG: hypothetical protein MUO85_05130 [candidate division Zixibacteria bacterium]|nr:hypothetical protein [candidate division Zixibacteria bacterium]
MQEERLEELRKVFKEIIEDITSLRSDAYLQRIADKLVYEVKIRINNKGGETN